MEPEILFIRPAPRGSVLLAGSTVMTLHARWNHLGNETNNLRPEPTREVLVPSVGGGAWALGL